MQDLIYVIEDNEQTEDLAYMIDSGNEAEWVDDVSYVIDDGLGVGRRGGNPLPQVSKLLRTNSIRCFGATLFDEEAGLP